MLTVSNLNICKFQTKLVNSYGEPVNETKRSYMYLYNKTQISDEELDKIIKNGTHMYDPRLVEITEEQLKYLNDK